MSDQEQRVQQALNDLEDGKYRSTRQAALANRVPKSIVAYRRRNRPLIVNKERKSQRFTNEEERALIQWIKDLQRQHISPNYPKLCLMLSNLLKSKEDTKKLGKHWITRFVARHPELKAGFSCTMDAKRLSALDSTIVEEFFAEFSRLKSTYNIKEKNIYNMDETGFQMGQTQREYVVYNSTEGPAISSESENTN